MFKVVIADDEYLICQLIKSLINWSELDLELVGEADNGIDAYNLLIEYKPEILITDIKMPRLDGLELVKRAREENISCKFVIISGHRHFEYAHNALKYNVEDYLLKPINKEDLNSTLQKVCKALLAGKQELEEKNKIYGQLENTKNSLKQHFINYTASEFKKVEGSNLNVINEEFELTFSKGIFQAALIKIDINICKHDIESYDSLLHKISDLCEKRLMGLCHEFISSLAHNGVLIVMNYDLNNISLVKKEIKSLFEDIKVFIDMFSYFSATLGIGTVQNTIDGVSKSVGTALNAVRCRIVLGRNKVIDASSLNYKIIELSGLITHEKERQLNKFFESLDDEGYKTWLKENLKLYNSEVYPALLYELGEKIADIFIDMMKNLRLELHEEVPLKDEIFSLLDCSKNMEEVLKSLYSPINARIQALANQKEMLNSKPIRDAKQYIAEHYMEQIKLEDVAKAAFLNPIYLSTAFKKNAGINFIDYLTNFRMDKAKELLKSTNYNIAEIAAQVGYIEPRYFSKMFAKTVGIKPKDYRKLYG